MENAKTIATQNQAIIEIDELLSMTDLTNGLHQLSVRFKDSNGYWSSIVNRSFYKLPIITASTESSTISEFQYWIDNNFENATSISIQNQEVVQIDELLSMADLTNGLHQFNVRFKDSNGYWSSIATTSFYKLPVITASTESSTISEFQYWVNNDFENATSISIQNQEIVQIDELLSMADLTNGLHQFSVRFKDSNGYWSSIKTTSFYKLPVITASTESSTISEFQYWIDNDFENAISIAHNQEVVQIDELLSMSELKNGLHQFNVRFKDSNGYWSSIKTTSFYKMPMQTVIIDPTITTYRYWFDDDIDNMFTITVDEPAEIFNWIEDLPMPEYMWSGERTMFVQFKDNSGYWSAPLEHVFEKNLDPRGNIYAENNSACGNELAQFYTDAVDIDVVYWDFGDGSPVVGRSPQSQIAHKYKQAGEYSVSALLRHEDSDTEIEREITITIHPNYGITETVLYHDDFEDAKLDTLPAGWVIRYNGTNTEDQKIVADPENEDNKVFSLSGSSGWAANLSCYIDEFPQQFALEARFFAQGIGDIRIGNPTVGSWGAYLGGVQYNNGTFIATNYKNSTGTVYTFDNVEPNVWHTVRLEFDFETLTYKVFLNELQQIGTNGGVEYEEFPIIEDIEPLSIELSSNSHSLYDDVKLFLPALHTNPTVEVMHEVCETDLPYQFGNQSLTESGIYTEMFQTSFGCDSLVMLDFKVNELSYGTDEIIACDSYTWIDGITYTESNNSAEFVLTNVAGCDSIVTLDLIINKSPNIEVVVDRNILTVAESDAIYQWKYCDDSSIALENAQEQIFVATANGQYVVEVSKNGCVATSECYEVVTVGIFHNLLNNITVYPNPNEGKFVVDLGKMYDEIYYEITDMQGAVVYENHAKTTRQLYIDMQVTKGVYTLSLYIDNNKHLIKIVVK